MMARLLWYLDLSSPHQNKKLLSKFNPLWQNFLDLRMAAKCDFQQCGILTRVVDSDKHVQPPFKFKTQNDVRTIA